MENFADQIEALLTKKRNAYRELVVLLKKERQAIVDMDIASLWEAVTIKNDIGKNILTLRRAILHLFEQKSIYNSMTVASFSLVELIFLLTSYHLERPSYFDLKLDIDREKAEVARIAIENQQHVRERLGVIEDLVATLIPMPELDRYGLTRSAMLLDKVNCFINKEV